MLRLRPLARNRHGVASAWGCAWCFCDGVVWCAERSYRHDELCDLREWHASVSRVGTRCAWQSSRPRHHWKQGCCCTLRSRPPCERKHPLQIDYRALAGLCRSSCVATTGHPHSFYPVIFVPPSSCPRVVEQAFGVGALAFAISIQLYGTYTPIRLPHLLPAAGGFPWGKAVVPRGFPH